MAAKWVVLGFDGLLSDETVVQREEECKAATALAAGNMVWSVEWETEERTMDGVFYYADHVMAFGHDTWGICFKFDWL